MLNVSATSPYKFQKSPVTRFGSGTPNLADTLMDATVDYIKRKQAENPDEGKLTFLSFFKMIGELLLFVFRLLTNTLKK